MELPGVDHKGGETNEGGKKQGQRPEAASKKFGEEEAGESEQNDTDELGDGSDIKKSAAEMDEVTNERGSVAIPILAPVIAIGGAGKIVQDGNVAA